MKIIGVRNGAVYMPVNVKEAVPCGRYTVFLCIAREPFLLVHDNEFDVYGVMINDEFVEVDAQIEMFKSGENGEIQIV